MHVQIPGDLTDTGIVANLFNFANCLLLNFSFQLTIHLVGDVLRDHSRQLDSSIMYFYYRTFCYHGT